MALFPWAASGRAIANGRDEGFTKLLFDAETHRIVGGGIVGTHAGDLISEIALAIEMGADAVDIGKTIHPHPTLGEASAWPPRSFEGVCTDLPPVRSRPCRAGRRRRAWQRPRSDAGAAARAGAGAGAGSAGAAAGCRGRHRLQRRSRCASSDGARRRARRARVAAGVVGAAPGSAPAHRSPRPARRFGRGLERVRPSCVVSRCMRPACGRRRHQVVLGVGVGAARGVELVLGVQQVEQAALADVELLAVGVARLLDGQRVAVEVVRAGRRSLRVSL